MDVTRGGVPMAKKRDRIDLCEWVKTRGTEFVIKVRGGKPYLSRKPRRDPARRKSPAEQKQVELFRLAVRYAREVLADPARRSEIEAEAGKRRRSVYIHAISTFLEKHRELRPRLKLPLKDVVVDRSGEYLFLKINLTEPVALKGIEVSLLELGSRQVEKGKAEQATVTAWWYIMKDEKVADLPFRVKLEGEAKEGEEIYEAQWVTV
ncbi:MAG: hypothetical protein AB1742_04635 [bacterium]